jgi:choice-of-anchor A domain-containing protein
MTSHLRAASLSGLIVACGLFAGPVAWASTINPMSEYNLIVFQDLDGNSHIQGKTFIGRDLLGTVTEAGAGLGLPYGSAEVSMKVGRNIAGTIDKVMQGSLEVGNNIAAGSLVEMNGGGNYAVGGSILGSVSLGTSIPLVTPPDISTIQSQLEGASDAYTNQPVNSSTSMPLSNRLEFDANPTGPENRAVFSIAGSTLSGAGGIAEFDLDLNGADEVIINVSGTSVNWNGVNLLGSFSNTTARERVVWNFFEATSLNFDRNVNGAVLAPYAHLTNSTNIDGSVAVFSMMLNGEVHLPTTTVSLIPEPASWVLGTLASLGLLAVRRRHQPA